MQAFDDQAVTKAANIHLSLRSDHRLAVNVLHAEVVLIQAGWPADRLRHVAATNSLNHRGTEAAHAAQWIDDWNSRNVAIPERHIAQAAR
ncbi:hypothetical protein D3C85_1639490 [compost metagenome]